MFGPAHLHAADDAGAARVPPSSTTRTSMPGSGLPTVPPTRAPSSGFDVIMPASVMP